MKSKKKVIGILITIILIAALAVTAYLYFFTDIFRTPEDLFYKYLEKASKSESDYSYKDMLEDLKKKQYDSYKQSATAQIEIKSKGTDYASRINQVTYDEISKLKLKFESQNVPSEKKMSLTLKAEHNDEEVTQINLVKNAEIYGIKSEFLDDKYIAIENKNLKSLARKIGGESANIPDQFEYLDMYDLLYIDENDQDRITDTYKDVIKNNISSDKYHKTENIVKRINNQDVNTTVYSLSIDKKDLTNVIVKILEKLKEDDSTLDLIIDKASKMSNINISSIKEVAGDLTKESLKEGIDNAIRQLQDNTQYNDDTMKLELALFVANGEVTRVEFNLYNKTLFAADMYKVEDKKHIDLYTSGDYTGLQKVFEIESKTTKSSSEGNFVIHQGYKSVKIEFNIQNKDDNSKTAKFNIDTENATITLTIDSEINYTNDVQVETLDSKNSIILNNMSKEELDKLFNEIRVRFQKTLVTKMIGLGLIEPNMLNAINVNM